MKKGTVALVISSAVWLVLLVAPSWAAPQYLGQSTWTISLTQNEDGPASGSATVTAAITRMGGTYYTMQGCIILPDDGPVILAGGGVLIGETLYLNLIATQSHTGSTWRDTGVWQVQLNKTTINGTFYEVGHDFLTSSSGPSRNFGNHFNMGTITLTGTPIVLSSALAGPTSLLLMDE